MIWRQICTLFSGRFVCAIVDLKRPHCLMACECLAGESDSSGCETCRGNIRIKYALENINGLGVKKRCGDRQGQSGVRSIDGDYSLLCGQSRMIRRHSTRLNASHANGHEFRNKKLFINRHHPKYPPMSHFSAAVILFKVLENGCCELRKT